MYLKINDHVTSLQSVEHEVEFILDRNGKDVNSNADRYQINARDFFVPTQVNFCVLSKSFFVFGLQANKKTYFSKKNCTTESVYFLQSIILERSVVWVLLSYWDSYPRFRGFHICS